MAVGFSDLYVFNVFDPVSKNMLYSKYNFNFALYSSSRNLDSSLTKTQVFKLFLQENGTTYDKPYSLSPELIQFFTPITQEMITYINSIGVIHGNYMSFTNPGTYISDSGLVESQFDLVEYNDTKIRFIQDYTYTTSGSGMEFTKYNFDFNSYSNDFNIYGSKLFIFTDFVFRCIHLSDAIPDSFGYGLPDQFMKYFLNIDNLNEYLVSHGVTSNNLGVYKNPANIDWNSYAKINTDINTTDQVVAKNHYYMYGQFEIRYFNFLETLSVLKNSDLIINATANIYSSTGGTLSSGFLYSNNDGNIYLICCYHIISDSQNLNVLRASFGLSSNVNNVPSKTTTAEFRIIGYDIMSDIIVGLFDPTLPYNSTFNVDLSKYETVGLTSSYSLNNGESVFFIGNIGALGNNSLISGNVMNTNYFGTLSSTFEIGDPDSILLTSSSVSGLSGSPIWIGNPEATDQILTCVGMVNSKLRAANDVVTFTQGIQAKIMVNVINNIIGNWFYFTTNPKFSNNSILISYLLKISSQKSWLGTTCSYFSGSTSTAKFPVLSNLPYTGGLIIEDFILGLNLVQKSFIKDVMMLGEFSAIKLNTPLLNTKIYQRYIESSKSPIVIKSLSYFNGLTSEYNKFYIGRYGNQVSFGSFTYGFLPLLAAPLNIPDADSYLFAINSVYPQLIIEYYYFDGGKWVLETESVGGTDASNYSTYTDSYGNKFYQNNFVLPYILYPYFSTYEDGQLLVLGATNSAGAFVPVTAPKPPT